MAGDSKKLQKNARQDFNVLEETLRSTMKPVDPSQAFVKDVRRRLYKYKEPGVIILEDRSLPYTLWILAGIVSGVVLLLICIRSMITMSHPGDPSRLA